MLPNPESRLNEKRIPYQRYLADAQELGGYLRLEPINGVNVLTGFYDNPDQLPRRTDFYGGHIFTHYLHNVQIGSVADAIADIPNTPDPVGEFDAIRDNFTVPFRNLTEDEISQIMYARQMARALRLPIPDGGQFDLNAINHQLESAMWEELGEWPIPERGRRNNLERRPDFYGRLGDEYGKLVRDKQPEYFPQMLFETLQELSLIDDETYHNPGANSELERLNQYYERAVDILNHESDPRLLAIASLLLPDIMERLNAQFASVMFTMGVVRSICPDSLTDSRGMVSRLTRPVFAAQNPTFTDLKKRYSRAMKFRFFGSNSNTDQQGREITVREISNAFNSTFLDYQKLSTTDPILLERRSATASKGCERFGFRKN